MYTRASECIYGPPSALFHQHVRLSDAVEIKTCVVVLLLAGETFECLPRLPTNPIYRGAKRQDFYYFANSGEREPHLFLANFTTTTKTNKNIWVWSTWNIKRTGPVFFLFSLPRKYNATNVYYPTDAALYMSVVRLICINCSSTAFSLDAGCRSHIRWKSSASIHKRRGLKR